MKKHGLIQLSAAVLLGLSVFALSGCATMDQPTNPTSANAQWVSPTATFEQKTITGLVVAAITDNPTNRRVFEDAACDVFALHGIPAQPSYQYIPDPANLSGANGVNFSALISAAAKAKASDVLIVKKRGVKTNVIYNPGMTWGPDPFWGPGPWGGPWGGPFGPDPFWGGWAIPPSVTQQQIALSNSELLYAKTGEVLWTASFSTQIGAASQLATFQDYAALVFQSLMNSGFMVPLGATNYPIAPAAKFNPQQAAPASLPR